MSFVDLDIGIERIKMKIRTDFVTNSSSYCTAEVIIDNPVLLEILQKYKDMGLFGEEDPIFSVGDYQIYGDSGAFEIIDDSHQAKTPAFYLYNDDEDEEIRHTGITDWTTPKSLEEVLEKIIELLSLTEEWLDIDVRDKLVEELTSRQVEILQAWIGALNLLGMTGIQMLPLLIIKQMAVISNLET